jgi:hypothetical protein
MLPDLRLRIPRRHLGTKTLRLSLEMRETSGSSYYGPC